jgi:hypothetical protein
MNFLVDPMACIHDNTPMDPEQIDVAATFVDELLELKIVKLVPEPEGKEVLTTAPPPSLYQRKDRKENGE